MRNHGRFELRIQLAIVVTLTLFIFCSPVNAGIWKPLCAEYHECTAPYGKALGGYAVEYGTATSSDNGPLVTQSGIIMQMGTPVLWRPNEQTGEWEYPGNDDPGFLVSNKYSVALSNGNLVSLSFYGPIDQNGAYEGAEIRSANNQVIDTVSWHGRDAAGLNNSDFIAPTIINQDIIYVGIRGGGGSSVYHSTDGGFTWQSKGSNIPLGSGHFNLLPNPENSALWTIKSAFLDMPGGLWESTDHGGEWSQVDDGSFPPDTMRVIHDPSNPNASFAITDHGLFVSFNRGVSWEATTLTEAVYGLTFVERDAPLTRVLVVGTDNGVKVSVTETASWQSMSNGLPEVPYTVTYAHGVLMASSVAGHFICNPVDCAGEALPLPEKTPSEIVIVTEFYHAGLDHYFISASQTETQAIEDGAAGPGWARTGHEFAVWNLLTSKTTTSVCRFYGSQNPGPNSHFFSISAAECSGLIDAQLNTPANKPRWNLEGYVFAAVPAILSDSGFYKLCPKHTQPIHRYYNKGASRGKDSNHRYVNEGFSSVHREMYNRGWDYEGIAFCVPG